MPQARDEAGNIWETDAQGNPVRLIQAASARPIAPVDPRIAPDVAKTQADAAVATATAPSSIRKAIADATKAEVDAGATLQEMRLYDDAQERKSIRQAFQTDTILGAIRRARKIVQEDGGVGFESLLSGVPTTNAKKLATELSPIFGNLAFDRLQQMRDESKTGGAVGNVSERELDLLASTVASLDTGVDAATFLQRLDTLERHFISTQLNALGVDPDSEEGRAAFKRDYGYTGVFEGETPRGPGLADPNATQEGLRIPPEYQDAHLRYLRENWGNIDPNGYTRFRAGLDQQFDLTPDLGAYSSFAPTLNEYAAKGGTPEGLGSVPAPTRDLGVVEQGLNKAAQSAPGAFFANVGNATAAGLPAYLGGNQNELELLRQVQPAASMGGEVVGSALGTAALGGFGSVAGGGRLGAMLARPLGSEVVHQGTYGATQDSDNPLRGAGIGIAGSIGGSVLGRQIGKAFPETYAGGAVRSADESVPTVDELKAQSARLYGDVEAQGVQASADQTADLAARMRDILADSGRIGGTGKAIIPDGPTRQANELIESFSGVPMSPTQALTIRETLGEGLTSAVPKERRIASNLLQEFDAWSLPVLPGADEARNVASRYIRGQQLENLTERGLRRGTRQKGNDAADATRTLFGGLDEKIGMGQAFFDPATQRAISKVAQGDPITNALRTAGKFGTQNPLTAAMGGGAAGAAGYAMGGPLVGGALGVGVAGGGNIARNMASKRTLRFADEAGLTALGGDEYLKLIEAARKLAADRAGRAYGGIFGTGAGIATREPTQ
jgi:hypothetical protein